MARTFKLDCAVVKPVVAAALGAVGFRVMVCVLSSLDDMFETLTHEALFATCEDAEELIRRIQAKRVLDLDHWVWSPNCCSGLAFVHEAPTARLSTVPRTLGRRA